MTVNTNVFRLDPASMATATAVLENTNYYGLERATPDLLTVVADPAGERGYVAKVTLNSTTPLVGGSHRTELSRDKFTAEYEFLVGGGYYWFSYMLDPVWLEKYSLLEASVPAVTDYSINIQQFHPRNIDGFIHPKWTIVVNEFGVCLRKWAQSDASGMYEIVAIWPVDSLVWHDVVTYAVWSAGPDGVFELYLDDKLVYRFRGPTAYVGSTKGSYFKQGIYSPGGFPPGITQLILYAQGFRQVYPAGNYLGCRGVTVRVPDPLRILL